MIISNYLKNTIATFAAALIIHGCFDVPDDFVAPTWDVEINVPITNRTYTVLDAIKDDPNFIVNNSDPNSLGQVTFVHSENISATSIADKLSIDSFNSSAAHAFGKIKLDDLEPITLALSADDISGAGLPGGAIIPVPSFEETISSNFNQSSNFEFITFNSGSMEFKIRNNMPVDLEIRGFEIKNALDNSIVASNSSWITVLQSDSASVIFPLRDKTIRNSLRLEATIYSPGSGMELVEIPSDAALEIDIVVLEDYEVRLVKADLPAQDPIVKDSTISIDNSEQPIRIQRAVVEAGTMEVTLNNDFDLNATIELLIYNLKGSDNMPYRRTIDLGRKEQNRVINEPNLSNWSFDNNGFVSDSIHYRFTVNTYRTTGMPTISNTDSIRLSFNFSDIVLKSFTGQIPPTEFNIVESSAKLDLGDFQDSFNFDQIALDDPDIFLRINSPSTFEMLINAQVDISNGIQVNTLDLVNVLIEAADVTNINLKDYGLTQVLRNFTGQFPTEFTFNGTAEINPNYLVGSVTMLDSISGDIDIRIPLNIGLAGGAIFDTLEIDMGEQSDKINDINFAQVIVELTNDIPISMSFTGYLLDSTNALKLKLPPRPLSYSNSDTIFVEAPQVDQNGNIVSSGFIKHELEIFGSEIEKLFQSRHLLLDIKFETPPNGSTVPVNFLVDDEVHIKIFARAGYRMDLSD